MSTGYAKLTTDEYAHLTTDGYAQLPLESGDTPTPSTSCAWTAATVTALQQSITSLASQVSALQTAVSQLAKTSDLTGLAKTTDLPTDYAKASGLVGLAKTSDLPTDYAKATDLPTDYAKAGDAMTLTSAYNAAKTAAPTVQEIWQHTTRSLTTPVTVNSTQATAFSQVADVSGLATSSALQAVKTSVDAIPTTTYTVPTVAQISSAVWGAESKEITGTVTVNSIQAQAFSAVTPATDISTLATATAVANLQTSVNAIPTAVAPSASVISDSVWEHATRTLTSSSSGVTPQEIWEYSNRSLTISPSSLTAQEVWEYNGTRSLTTSFPDVPTTGEIAEEVWGSDSRTITGTVTVNSEQANLFVTATGFATPSNVTAAQNTILAGCATATGFATANDVTSAKEAILARGNVAWTTATGFTVPSDIPSDYAKANGLVGLAKTTDLTGLAKTTDLPTDYAKAGDAMTLTAEYNAAKTSAPTAQNIWEYTSRTLTSGGGSGGTTAQEVWEYSTRTLTASPTDVSTLAKSTEITALQTHGDSTWSTAEVDEEVIAEAVWEYENRTLTAEEEIPGSVYCTRHDVERRWGIQNVSYWANTDNSQENKEARISAQISWAIETASRKIDSDLSSSMYVTPFSPVPADVRKYCAVLAGIELYSSRRMQETEDGNLINTAMSDYHSWIAMILNGGIIAGATLFVSEN